jgi:sirohydrochlorin cobaltochelatase
MSMSSPSKTGWLLFAHGARDPEWARPFEAVATRLRAERPADAVGLAFLEFMAPDLGQAADALAAVGCTRIEVVPLFLGTGGHVRRDVPPLLDAARERHPGIALRLHPSVGAHDEVIVGMARAALAVGEDR